MKIYIIGFIALLFPAFGYCANWIDKSGKTVADQDDMKSSENFIAHLILTTKEDLLLKNWQTPSHTVKVDTSKEVERNKPISSFIIFGGCKVDSKGNCNLVAKFTIYQPDGKTYADIPETEVWVDKPVPPNRNIELGLAHINLVVEDGEPLGKYNVEAIITDKNDGKSVILHSHFLVKEASH